MVYTPIRKPGAWRRTTQALFTLGFLAAPWLTVGGGRFVGLDVEAGRLYVFGTVLRVSELHLLLLLTLALTFLFLWVATSAGRLWCGWGCPQTILSDLAEWLLRKTGRGKGRLATAGFHLLMMAVAVGLSATLALYFVPPARFFSASYFSTVGPGVVLFAVTAVVLYADMVWVRRGFCRVACPYGKLLTVLSDRNALTVVAAPARMEACIRCDACTRVCPMELDVREGAGGDCLRCGRCVDACVRSLAKAKKDVPEGLIGYTFGNRGMARSTFFGWRKLPLLLAFLAALTGWLWFATREQAMALQVRVAAAAPVRTTPAGEKALFFDAVIVNPFEAQRTVSLDIIGPKGKRFSPAGIGEILELAPEERLRARFALTLPARRVETELPLTFRLIDSQGEVAARARLVLPPLL